MLTADENERYAWHLKLPGMGPAAQARLFRSRVLVVGLSGTGSVAAVYLASAGVGELGLLDDGLVKPAALTGQVCLSASDAGNSRISATRARIASSNPGVAVAEHSRPFDAQAAEEVIAKYDLVLDGLTDWQEKLLASDASMRHGRPLLHSFVCGYNWHHFTILPGRTACLRCAAGSMGIDDLPPAPGQTGAFGPALGMCAAFQAGEAVKHICQIGPASAGQLARFDGLKSALYTTGGLKPVSDCPDCGGKP